MRIFWTHFTTQAERYFRLVRASRASLIISLLAGLIAICLLRVVTGTPEALAVVPEGAAFPSALKVVFILTCINLQRGLLFSVREIVSETERYEDERLYGLIPTAYVLSKLAVRGGIAFVQSLAIVLFVLVLFQAPAAEVVPWGIGLYVTTWLTIVAALSLGLLLSTVSNNTDQASNLMLFVTIAQIVLSGVLFKVEGAAKLMSWLAIGRWSVGAYATPIDLEGQILGDSIMPGAIVEETLSKLPIPIDPYAMTFDNLALNWGILLAHILVYVGLACFVKSSARA